MQEAKSKLIKSSWLLFAAICLTSLAAFGGIWILSQFPHGEDGLALTIILILVAITFPILIGCLFLQIFLSLLAIKWNVHFFLGIVNLLESIVALLFYGWVAAACLHDVILLAVIFILGMVCILLAAVWLLRRIFGYCKAKMASL